MSVEIKISQEMISLYDDYTHRSLDRRDFLNKLTRLAGSSAAATALVPLLEANKARAALTSEDDKGLHAELITYKGWTGPMEGYLALPSAGAGPLPAIMVIHENRGLNAHIKDVVRRLALEGFLTLGPDFLSSVGGTPEDEDKARDLISKLDTSATLQDAVATVGYLRGHDRSNGKVGAVGFCWGGGLVNQTAVNAPELSAGVAYYGMQPAAADVSRIKAKLMLHYAGLDDRINAGIPAYRSALEAAKIDHVIYIYEGVNHAFNNDTSEARYNKQAADLAWSRTVDFLKTNLD